MLKIIVTITEIIQCLNEIFFDYFVINKWNKFIKNRIWIRITTKIEI